MASIYKKEYLHHRLFLKINKELHILERCVEKKRFVVRQNSRKSFFCLCIYSVCRRERKGGWEERRRAYSA